jgi:hypothetical protein
LPAAPRSFPVQDDQSLDQRGLADDEEADDYHARNKRQSVDWYAGLAADQANGDDHAAEGPAASFAGANQLDSHAEEEEKGGADELDEFDLSKGMCLLLDVG